VLGAGISPVPGKHIACDLFSAGPTFTFASNNVFFFRASVFGFASAPILSVFGVGGALLGSTTYPAAAEVSIVSTEPIGSVVFTPGTIPAFGFIQFGSCALGGGGCCFEEARCQALVEADCLATNGTFAGDGLPCSAAKCPHDLHLLQLLHAKSNKFTKCLDCQHQHLIPNQIAC